MSKAAEVAQALYGRVIESIEWPFFGRTLMIAICGDRRSKLILRGVHLCTFRQSLLGPESIVKVEGCSIYAVGSRKCIDLQKTRPTK